MYRLRNVVTTIAMDYNNNKHIGHFVAAVLRVSGGKRKQRGKREWAAAAAINLMRKKGGSS